VGAAPGSEPEVQALNEFLIRPKFRPAALIQLPQRRVGNSRWRAARFSPVDQTGRGGGGGEQLSLPARSTPAATIRQPDRLGGHVRGIPSLDIELSTHLNTDFDQNLRVLQAFLDWKK